MKISMKLTLVLGASENPQRYSNMAMKNLLEHGHPIVAIGKKAGNAYGTVIQTGFPELKSLDTITLYLNPQNQRAYYDYILELKPKRIIFNPGTENEDLEKLATDAGILCMSACTLVLLKTNQY